MKSIITLALLVTIVGCNNSVRPPKVGRDDPYEAQQIHFASEELRRDTAVSKPIVSRDEAGLLFVSVPIRSAVDKTIYVDYRVTFYDQTGQEVGKTSWARANLEANVPQRITVNSTTARATDFQMDFRYSR
jgi:uncharacterized protein YcfL